MRISYRSVVPTLIVLLFLWAMPAQGQIHEVNLTASDGVQAKGFRTVAISGEQAPMERLAGRMPVPANSLPESFDLEAAYPNPFNPSTTIQFALPEQAQVSLVVYDMLGREVQRLGDGVQDASFHEVVFEVANLPSGMYLYRLETPEDSFVRGMHLLK